ncbi:MAG: hypothetical protein ABIQ53_04230 [Terracoccus sp.]
MSIHHLLRSRALLEAFLLPTVLGVFVLLIVHPLTLALPVLLVLVVIGTWSMVRASRRTLTVTENGLQVQRDRYRLEAPWHAVMRVDRGQRRALVKADEIVLTDSRIIALDYRDRATTLPKGLEGHLATRRVQVSLYNRDWAAGPLGEHLREHGVEF